MVKLIALLCSNCGAKLELPENQKKAFCSFCGTELLINAEEKTVKVVHLGEVIVKKDVCQFCGIIEVYAECQICGKRTCKECIGEPLTVSEIQEFQMDQAKENELYKFAYLEKRYRICPDCKPKILSVVENLQENIDEIKNMEETEIKSEDLGERGYGKFLKIDDHLYENYKDQRKRILENYKEMKNRLRKEIEKIKGQN